MGERHGLTRALTNLLQNALRHGRGDVEVTLQATEPWARVSVRDHGPGVPPEDRARVFSRFVQLSTGDAKAAEGMGIGLALVKEIAEQHGGDVGVDVAPGGGALFWLTLPTGSDHLAIEDVAIDDVSPASPQRRAPPARPPEAPTGGPKLLLVEDNDELRGYLVSRLSSRYDVIEATNGDEGLAAARARRPDVILSDVRMPGKDGLQMVRELRADPALARVPVMFLSAKTQEEDRVAGLQLADDYLTKPFGTQELLARLARLTPGAAPVTPPPVESAFVERLTATADRSLGDADFHVAELAKAMAMSVRALQVRMKSIGLSSPAEWLLERRLSRARELMRSGAHETVGEVADAVGLSRTYLARAYRAWAGKTPREELRAGAT